MADIGKWQWHDYDVLDSTNDLALSYPVYNNDVHIIFTALSQTKGRGRIGRRWFSPRGNLYMSQLFFSSLPSNQMVYVVALSIVQTIKKFSPDSYPQIKWPNDILLNNHKVCGILIEKRSDDAYVIGIGLNLTQTPQIETVYPAASLRDFAIDISRREFISTYISLFEKNLMRPFAEIIDDFLSCAYRLRQTIDVNLPKEKISGQFIGIDENGFLLLKQGQDVITINTGEILS